MPIDRSVASTFGVLKRAGEVVSTRARALVGGSIDDLIGRPIHPRLPLGVGVGKQARRLAVAGAELRRMHADQPNGHKRTARPAVE